MARQTNNLSSTGNLLWLDLVQYEDNGPSSKANEARSYRPSPPPIVQKPILRQAPPTTYPLYPTTYAYQHYYPGYPAPMLDEPRPANQNRTTSNLVPPIALDAPIESDAIVDTNVTEGVAQPKDWVPDLKIPQQDDFDE